MTHDDVSDENNLIVVSYDPGRSKHSLFDFKTLELSFPLASAFRRGFIALYGHCSAGTQRTNWAKTRKFAKFLRDADLADKVQLPETVLSEFYSWLNASGAKSITAYAALTNCHAILSYCERNNRRLLSRKTRLILPPKPAQLPTRRELLPDDLVKKILAICHANIVAAEERLALGRRLLAGETRTCHEALQARIIHELLAIGRGELPTRTEIRKISRKTMDRIDSIGGMREISRLIWLCNEDMFSFYLAILIQTSGNPSAILEIERDCITPHPLRSDLERVVWIKRRSHAEQHVEAPVGRSWSAPNLIRRIEALNEWAVSRVKRNRGLMNGS